MTDLLLDNLRRIADCAIALGGETCHPEPGTSCSVCEILFLAREALKSEVDGDDQ